MQKKLTITIDEKVYSGLHRVIGRRRISSFIESLVRPHVIQDELLAAYEEMAHDEVREAEALEWAEQGLDGPEDSSVHMRSDERVDDFVLDAYARDGRSSEVVALVWRRFEESAHAQNFARLKERTEPLDVWPDLRLEAQSAYQL